METIIKFYDTCSLLIAGDSIFEKNEFFFISSITLKELERIKTSSNKDADIKYSARLLLHQLENNSEKYQVVVHKTNYEDVLVEMNFEINDDARILSDAWYIFKDLNGELTFITNDLSLKNIATCIFPRENIESVDEDTDNYNGIAEIEATNEEIAKLYENPNENHFGLEIGQYLILKDTCGETVDLRVWTGSTYRYLKYSTFDSDWFGKVKPYDGDIYQKCAFDSLCNNQITMVQGQAATGKSYVSLAYLFYAMERNIIDKIVVFCNPIAAVNAAKLGFYPGDKNSKLLDSQIGNMLVAKLGSQEGVIRLIEDGRLLLLPFSDIRGFDTSGMRAGVYITEAQNLDRTLMKLALQRIGEDSICIIDGDANTQVDLKAYEGTNNGMRRMSKVFRGSNIYGEVELHKIHRSLIAEIANKI